MKLHVSTPNRLRERSERGMALIMVMVISGVAFLVVASVLMSSSTTSRLTMRSMAHARSVAASDAGLEVAVSLMRQDLRAQGSAYLAGQVAANAYVPTIATVLTQQVAGITALSASITSQVTTNAGEDLYEIVIQTEMADAVPGRSRVSLGLRVLDLPVTSFCYFYEVDLEHYAWHDWVVTGPVYCGSTNYFRPTSGAVLTFTDNVFSVGPTHLKAHPLEPNQVAASDVQFLAGKLERVPSTVAHSPAGVTNGMRWILEEPLISDYGTPVGSQRFFNKADVIVRLDDSGVSVNQGPRHGNVYVGNSLPACLQTSDTLSVTNFWDGRETRYLQWVALDAGEVPRWMVEVFGGAAPSHPVIYIVDQRTIGGLSTVRLVNGDTLGGNGFTLATPNPLYVKGNFNVTDPPKPVMLAADAITVLSGAWEDSRSALALGDRPGVSTTVNSAVITGIVPPNGDQGSGWVATVLRLLEDWRGQTISFTGSTAVLFHSEVAVGVFIPGSFHYHPDRRLFTFADFFAGAPLAEVLTVKMALRSDYKALTPL
jgi:hypothetical protein